jgi:CRISPR-associated protein Csx17
MAEVVLAGCTPEPLMGYLKALGVFRLIAEQADPSTQGMWRGNQFVLESSLNRDRLVSFFLEEYRPTPIVGPWGARSGFYPGSSESSARQALDAIINAAGRNPRLAPFRDTIAAVRSILARYNFIEKVRDEDKLTLMRACRNELPDDLLPWLDAVFVLTDDSRRFPPLLGTGGNEGSGSYTSTFAQIVVELLLRQRANTGLATSLFDEPGAVLGDASVGHFNPGAVGGPNSGQGFSGGGGVNLWDYLFALEGVLLFAGAAVRRLGVDAVDKAAFPFTVNSVAVGYGSAAGMEETTDGSRAEVWLPLWSQPATLAEIAQLFAEGRAQLSRRQARNAIEFALAVCLLGVSRGISAFIRYGFLKRNGLSFFASPLGRVPVNPKPQARLLDDPPLTEWLDRLRAACRDKDKTPARYQAALRNIDGAMYQFAVRSQTDRTADRRALLEVLSAVGRAERTLANGLAFCEDKYLRPLQGLSSQWLDQANDDSPEFRLAASIAGIRAVRDTEIGPFRVHLEPVAVNRAGRFEWDGGSTSAVWTNRSLDDNLAAVFYRRQMEAFRAGQVGVPLDSPRPCRLIDVIAFLNDETDDDKLHDLIWGLSLVERQPDRADPQPIEGLPVPFEYGVPRLLVEPLTLTADRGRWQLGGIEATTPDPGVFHILLSGRRDAVEQSIDRAARRLKSSGRLVVGYRNRRQAGKPLAVVSPLRPTRLLAACLFPLSDPDLETIANTVLYQPEIQE